MASLKIVLINFVFFSLGMVQLYSQTGCTDPLANNFDPNATVNNGSCTYDAVVISPAHSYPLDEVISETSGLIAWNGMLWTHNDNEDPLLYKIDPSNGSISGNFSLDPQQNVDWEEISQDENYIYVGDFGNNAHGNRTDLHIIRISKSSILTGTPEMELINFSYEDQVDFTSQPPNATDYDCEAFIVTEDYIFLFTKEWLSHNTRIYKLDKEPGTHQALLQDSYNVDGLVTGSVYKTSEGIVALSGYNEFLQPFFLLLYDFTEDDFFGGNKRKLQLNLPFHQVEGITSEDGLNYFITNEKFQPTATLQQLHTLDLATYLEGFLHISTDNKGIKFHVFPNPATSFLEIRNIKSSTPLKYIIYDVKAKKVKNGVLLPETPIIDISELSVGTYFLQFAGEISDSIQIIKK